MLTASDSTDIEDKQPEALVENTITPEPEIKALPVTETISGKGKEETTVPENPIIKMTRKQLYDEIWEISVAGVAKKYDIPYAHLMKQIKEAGIPIPPSGYWTKLSHGKPVTKLGLPEPANEVLSIYKIAPVTRKKKKIVSNADTLSPVAAISQNSKKPVLSEKKQTYSILLPENNGTVGATHNLEEPETYERYGQAYNVYDRETLYKEVWERPVTEVAKRYKVSDVAIHKVCKSLEIPTPPAGYWAKLRAGKPVAKIPLPESSKPVKKTVIRNGTEYQPQIEKEMLTFLGEEDRAVVLSVATQIRIPDENAKMHLMIITHRKAVIQWKKKLKEQEAKGWGRRGMDSPPFLADTVSEEALPRVFSIINALIKAMEPLGCSLTEDLKYVINGETVSISISEAKNEVKHVLTKEENMQLLKYEDEKRRHSWASKPNIRKYDYLYNGRITLTINNSKKFRDNKSYVVEDRLGDIMIELYEASDVIRKEREVREEAERKRQEEERRKEERRERYNAEVDRTLSLVNLAGDYETSCKIRHYVSAVETSGNLDEKTMAWIKWAKAKADWYDPTMAREDEFFGKRDHKKNADQKKLEHAGYKWW
jgi:hypothetical protein